VIGISNLFFVVPFILKEVQKGKVLLLQSTDKYFLRREANKLFLFFCGHAEVASDSKRSSIRFQKVLIQRSRDIG
jgi:hypothetical protein